MRLRLGSTGKNTSSFAAESAFSAGALTMAPPVEAPSAAAFSRPSIGTHQNTRSTLVVPAVKEITNRVALKVAKAGNGIAAAAGADGFEQLHIQVGIGYACIDAHMPSGQVLRCEGTTEAFGLARRELVQEMQRKYGTVPPACLVVWHAAKPDEAKLIVNGQ